MPGIEANKVPKQNSFKRAVGNQLNPNSHLCNLALVFSRYRAILRSIGHAPKIGIDAIEVRKVQQLSEIDGLIIPGGESTTIVKLLTRFEFVTLYAKE
ncbi:MAG: hypothetical protein CM1200mP39_10340 [Dehalococcoidia bacterium]|nr:MAG: hypothetical protein CM1200mP39_10340 [Dehalococcoidia bacterium]